MRDSDELTNIPPIVPSRDDVSSHEQARRGQSQDIVRPTHRIQAVRVSTWPVRIVLTILCLTIIGAGAGAYYFYDDYQADLRQNFVINALHELLDSHIIHSAKVTMSDSRYHGIYPADLLIHFANAIYVFDIGLDITARPTNSDNFMSARKGINDSLANSAVCTNDYDFHYLAFSMK